ncbi:hypothetical protein BS50DRAFT_645634 [Corynespora cassiicola Philippines]|uniref:Uncharacterized protein n=1 Tax=Corynespora cassiicola Philippines TaxID=1448308 RepID=A0A2T2NJ27_CORCC|nr:hypothetical protein BS50DRAFT_645634 [Corynespora cassiicola Philippines]
MNSNSKCKGSHAANECDCKVLSAEKTFDNSNDQITVSQTTRQKKAELLKLIARFSILWQAAFLIFSQNAFPYDLRFMSTGRDCIEILETLNDIEKTRQALFVFPTEMGCTPEQKKHLMANRSYHAIAYLHRFAEKLLNGIDGIEIFELKVLVRTPLKVRILSLPDERGNRKICKDQVILRIFSHELGIDEIVDCCGPIYGFESPSMAKEAYVQNYVNREYGQDAFGTQMNLMVRAADDSSEINALKYDILTEAEKFMRNGVLDWQANSQVYVQDILHLSEKDFVQVKNSLLSAITQSMEPFLGSTKYHATVGKAVRSHIAVRLGNKKPSHE